MKSWITIFLICALSAAPALAKSPKKAAGGGEDAELIDALSQIETGPSKEPDDDDMSVFPVQETKVRKAKVSKTAKPLKEKPKPTPKPVVKLPPPPKPKPEPVEEELSLDDLRTGSESEEIVESEPVKLAPPVVKEPPKMATKVKKKAPRVVKEEPVELSDIAEEIPEPPPKPVPAAGPKCPEFDNAQVPPEVAKKIADAEIRFKAKDYHAAINLIGAYASSLPRKALNLLAHSYKAVDNHVAEVRAYDLAHARCPKDHVILTDLGEALGRSRRYDDAIGALFEARDLSPKYRRAYEAALVVFDAKGENYEARSLVNDMIKKFGDIPAYHTALCRLYFQGDYLEKAVEVCENAIKKDPTAADNYVYLGRSLKDQEKLSRATKLLVDAADRFPAASSVQTATGDMYLAKEEFVTAHTYFKKAAAADPKSARAWVGYANASFKLQKHEEALAAFVRACKLDRREVKDFRVAIGELRNRGDKTFQSRYESGINNCE